MTSVVVAPHLEETVGEFGPNATFDHRAPPPILIAITAPPELVSFRFCEFEINFNGRIKNAKTRSGSLLNVP
jgi:hypothetical protein